MTRPPRFLRFRVGILFFPLLLALPANAGSRPSRHYGDGFSIDLDEPYDRVLQVVKSICEDGFIRGSSEYKGAGELYGSVPATGSKAFHTPPAPGTVVYKMRANTLAPDHFLESNDVGTVTVRYVVNALGPKSTRLSIDAVFQEDSHHHYHPSDGTVENAEFLAIADAIKDIEDREAKQKQETLYAAEAQKMAGLQAQLDQARADLKAAKAKEEEAARKVQAISGGKPGRVRTASADLKAEPYNDSKTLSLLSQGDPVTVLQETRSWCRVQAAGGQQGWVYRLLLEPPQ